MRGMYRKSAGMRGDVKEDDIRLGKGGVGWKGAASVEGNTSTWPMGPSGLCFCGTQTFFCLTEPESDCAEPGKENLKLFFCYMQSFHTG